MEAQNRTRVRGFGPWRPRIGLGFEVFGPWRLRIGVGFEVLDRGGLELDWGSRFWALEAQNWTRVRGFGPWQPRIGLGFAAWHVYKRPGMGWCGCAPPAPYVLTYVVLLAFPRRDSRVGGARGCMYIYTAWSDLVWPGLAWCGLVWVCPPGATTYLRA